MECCKVEKTCVERMVLAGIVLDKSVEASFTVLAGIVLDKSVETSFTVEPCNSIYSTLIIYYVR